VAEYDRFSQALQDVAGHTAVHQGWCTVVSMTAPVSWCSRRCSVCSDRRNSVTSKGSTPTSILAQLPSCPTKLYTASSQGSCVVHPASSPLWLWLWENRISQQAAVKPLTARGHTQKLRAVQRKLLKGIMTASGGVSEPRCVCVRLCDSFRLKLSPVMSLTLPECGTRRCTCWCNARNHVPKTASWYVWRHCNTLTAPVCDKYVVVLTRFGRPPSHPPTHTHPHTLNARRVPCSSRNPSFQLPPCPPQVWCQTARSRLVGSARRSCLT